MEKGKPSKLSDDEKVLLRKTLIEHRKAKGGGEEEEEEEEEEEVEVKPKKGTRQAMSETTGHAVLEVERDLLRVNRKLLAKLGDDTEEDNEEEEAEESENPKDKGNGDWLKFLDD
jgi:hypothetical protein